MAGKKLEYLAENWEHIPEPVSFIISSSNYRKFKCEIAYTKAGEYNELSIFLN